MKHYRETEKEITCSGAGAHITCEWWEKLKDSTDVAKAFNNFFIKNYEKFNIQQIQKGDATSILKDSFPGTPPPQKKIKIIPITEAEKAPQKIIT